MTRTEKVSVGAVIVAFMAYPVFSVASCVRRDIAANVECRTLGYVRGAYIPGAGVSLCEPSPVTLDDARSLHESREETPR
jgi:hypothetical protein